MGVEQVRKNFAHPAIVGGDFRSGLANASIFPTMVGVNPYSLSPVMKRWEVRRADNSRRASTT
jgi:hypothetical protein